MCNLVAHVNVGWVIMYMTVCLSKWTVLYHMYMSHVQCITCVFELMNVLYHMYMSHVQCITCVFELMNVLYHMYMSHVQCCCILNTIVYDSTKCNSSI